MNELISFPDSSALFRKTTFTFKEIRKLKKIIFLFTVMSSMIMIKAQKPNSNSGKVAFGDWHLTRNKIADEKNTA